MIEKLLDAKMNIKKTYTRLDESFMNCGEGKLGSAKFMNSFPTPTLIAHIENHSIVEI
jgi:hypothetical protein